MDRGPGGKTRLTHFGDVLVKHARSQLAGDERARAELASLAAAESGVVTIGIGETFAGDIIATAVSALHRSNPGLRVNLVDRHIVDQPAVDQNVAPVEHGRHQPRN